MSAQADRRALLILTTVENHSRESYFFSEGPFFTKSVFNGSYVTDYVKKSEI